MEIILASGSQIRAQLLRNAGVSFGIVPARVDETSIIAALQAEGAKPADVCDTLAEYKARQIAAKHPDKLIIGCDQVLVCEGRLFVKPATLDEARNHLTNLRGNGHQLLSAVVIYEAGAPVWRTIGRAQLVMRSFTDEFLDHYIETQGEDMLSTVGCYKLEGAGVALFSKVQGDHFTILGLPLLEVLDFLRGRKAIPA